MGYLKTRLKQSKALDQCNPLRILREANTSITSHFCLNWHRLTVEVPLFTTIAALDTARCCRLPPSPSLPLPWPSRSHGPAGLRASIEPPRVGGQAGSRSVVLGWACDPLFPARATEHSCWPRPAPATLYNPAARTQSVWTGKVRSRGFFCCSASYAEPAFHF